MNSSPIEPFLYLFRGLSLSSEKILNRSFHTTQLNSGKLLSCLHLALCMATVLPALGPNFLGGAGGAPALWVKATRFRCRPSWEEAVLRPEVHREKGLRPYFVWSC